MPDFLRWLTSDDVYPWVMGMLGILVLVLFRLWALVRRLRGDGLVLVGDDPTDEADDLMAVADAVREDTWTPAQPGDTPGELVPGEDDRTPEPTARYEPCTETWAVDQQHPCGDGHWHRCTRLPGGHHRHVCQCGARSDDGPVLVIDPPTVRQYVDPDSGAEARVRGQSWVTFGTWRVHQACLDARRDARQPCPGCAPHLVGAAGNLPTGGAA